MVVWNGLGLGRALACGFCIRFLGVRRLGRKPAVLVLFLLLLLPLPLLLEKEAVEPTTLHIFIRDARRFTALVDDNDDDDVEHIVDSFRITILLDYWALVSNSRRKETSNERM